MEVVNNRTTLLTNAEVFDLLSKEREYDRRNAICRFYRRNASNKVWTRFPNLFSAWNTVHWEENSKSQYNCLRVPKISKPYPKCFESEYTEGHWKFHTCPQEVFFKDTELNIQLEYRLHYIYLFNKFLWSNKIFTN